jgi:hypothetical protein
MVFSKVRNLALTLALPGMLVSAHPSPHAHHEVLLPRQAVANNSNSTGAPQIFFGRFISTPDPDTLLIQTGAVLVTSENGRGYINATTFDLADGLNASTASVAAALGVGDDVPVTTIADGDDAFFFPGFIGTFPTFPVQYRPVCL